MVLVLSFGWLITAGFLAVTLHRRESAAPVLRPAVGPVNASVSAIVPARDEERSIEACVRSLVGQDHPHLEVIVVDDGSSDRTAAIASGAGARVVAAGPLSPGWAGKPHACATGAAAASGEWLVFVDADTMAEPGLVSAAVSRAVERRLDVLSPHPRQEVATFWERVVIPAGFFLLAVTRDVRRINDPQRRAAAVNGQCVVVRTSAYREIGGHGAVAGEVLEDVALGREAKRRGLRLELVDGSRFIRTRMYRSAGEIWRGLTKNAAQAAGGPALAAAAVPALLGLAAAPVAVPAAALAAGSPLAVAAALGGTTIFIGLSLRGPRFFGLPARWGAALPLGLVSAAAITAAGVVKTLFRAREWKGRRY
jgi:chlorobactene glucosyltransferase